MTSSESNIRAYLDDIKRQRAQKHGWAPPARDNGSAPDPTSDEWPEPKPLPSGLLPVEKFSMDFMPAALGPWVEDIANRLQCPPDYVAVTAIVALGSVIGRRVGIKPQRKTDWVEVPNVWGMFIGRPGMLKSPAMMEALRPLRRLEAEAAKENQAAQEAYECGLSAFKLRKEVAISLKKKELKKSVVDLGKFKKLAEEAAAEIDLAEPEEPIPVRYRTNDSSYEAIGELLIANPVGILVERDEIVSLLKHLDRDDQAVARGFYLSGWSGMQPYTFDRIVRGHRHIEAVCLAVLGNTQPARISEYIRRANLGGAGGDGLMQRFNLLVWPDPPTDWRDVDEYPNSDARAAACAVFDRVSKLDEEAVLKAGALKGDFDSVPYIRLDDEAAADFLEWRAGLEKRLRSGELSPALEGHLAKYRKLVPALSLINHLADIDEDGKGAVSKASLLRALSFASYLESHARRLYASASEAETSAAKAILKRVRSGELKDGFTARDVHQHGWSHLTERDQVSAGLCLLVDLDHLAVSERAPLQGGRPKTAYRINPRVMR
jgi:hypothetical protein